MAKKQYAGKRKMVNSFILALALALAWLGSCFILLVCEVPVVSQSLRNECRWSYATGQASGQEVCMVAHG